MEYTSKKLPDGSIEITTRLSAAFLQASRKEAAARDLPGGKLLPGGKYLVTCADGVSHMIWAFDDLHAWVQAIETCGGAFGSVVPLSAGKQAGIDFEEFIEASTGAVRRALAARRRESPGEPSPVGPITIGIAMEPDSGKLDVKRETSDALSDFRSLALMAGDFHRLAMNEVRSLMKLSPDDRIKRAQDALGELRSNNVLTDAEAGSLTQVLETVSKANLTANNIAEQVSIIFQQLRASEAGPVSLTIASIATDSTRAAASSGTTGETETLIDALVAAGDFAGAVVGAAAVAGTAKETGLAGPLLGLACAGAAAAVGTAASLIIAEAEG